jgi:hypothetical protein
MEEIHGLDAIACADDVIALALEDLHHHFTGDGRIFNYQYSAHGPSGPLCGRLAWHLVKSAKTTGGCLLRSRLDQLLFVIGSAGDAELFLRYMTLGLVTGLIAAISLAGGNQLLTRLGIGT